MGWQAAFSEGGHRSVRRSRTRAEASKKRAEHKFMPGVMNTLPK
jgi:hypothetical protein